MTKINEATDTDLKVIELLKNLGWKPGDTLLYQQEYILTPEQQKTFEGRKSIRPDITLTDLNGNILALFENKFEDVWLVESPLSVALFYNKEGIKLVTGYHEPSMLVRSVWRVWNIGKESLTLERTFGDILDYDK